MHNNCGVERMALYADNIGSTLYGDLSKASLIDLNYALMGFKERSYDQIPYTYPDRAGAQQGQLVRRN
jgi:hypothetical protein